MDFKDLAGKAKDALGKNPGLIDKAGELLDHETGGKYSGQLQQAEGFAKKWVGVEGGQPAEAQQPAAGQQPAEGQQPPEGGQPAQ